MKKILTLLLVLVAITSLVYSAENDLKQNQGEELGIVVARCPVIPVRNDPSEASEQEIQLQFGISHLKFITQSDVIDEFTRSVFHHIDRPNRIIKSMRTIPH